MDGEENKDEGMVLNSKEDLIKLITDLTKRVDALTPKKEEEEDETGEGSNTDEETRADDDELENLIKGL